MSTARIWVTADLHLGHSKVATTRGFANANAHDAQILSALSRCVHARDTLIILGDLTFGEHKDEMVRSIRAAISCSTLRLVVGNHDKVYHTHLDVFDSIEAYRVEGTALLSHMPVHESQFDRWSMNIHGHLHSKTLPDQRYKCVSLEQYGLMPVLLNDLIKESSK